MATYTFKPSNVCSREFNFDIEDGLISSFSSIGGCNGNLQGIASLLKGMKVEDAINKLEGIKCRGSRNGETSCHDQIARALKAYLNKQI